MAGILSMRSGEVAAGLNGPPTDPLYDILPRPLRHQKEYTEHINGERWTKKRQDLGGRNGHFNRRKKTSHDEGDLVKEVGEIEVFFGQFREIP
jgi:hypothetical protein